jgi:hypothetical protein
MANDPQGEHTGDRVGAGSGSDRFDEIDAKRLQYVARRHAEQALARLSQEERALEAARQPWYRKLARLVLEAVKFIPFALYMCFVVCGIFTIPVLFLVLWRYRGLGLALGIVIPLIVCAIASLPIAVIWGVRKHTKKRSLVMDPAKNKPYRGLETTAITVATVVAFFVLGYLLIRETDVRWLAYSLMLLAIMVGYIVGLLLTPYTKREQGDFEKILKALSLFLSGFLLSKLEPVFKSMASATTFKPDQVFLPVSFAGCFLASCIAVFVYRKYVFGFEESDAQDKSENSQKAKKAVAPPLDEREGKPSVEATPKSDEQVSKRVGKFG